MVQTEQQYICIHQCLLAVLDGKENDLPSREIHSNDGYDGMLIVNLNLLVLYESNPCCVYFTDDEGIAESGM